RAEEPGPVDEPSPILRDFPHRLETERLVVRRPEPGDGAAGNAAIRETWGGLPEWMPGGVEGPPVDESEEFVRRAHAKFALREDLLLFLFEKSSGDFVGGTGLHRIDWRVPSFDIGYWCRARFQRRGFITESTAGVADFAEREL